MVILHSDPDAPEFTRRFPNLADPRLGARAVAASDEFFAPKERMLSPQPAVFVPGKYDDNGKWMDGWESRRKRTTGHDWCVVRLAHAAVVRGVDIDTSHFTGNFPPAAMLEGCVSEAETPAPDAAWHPVVPASALGGNRHHYLAADGQAGVCTHVRLNIYPDGGVARLRVYGEPRMDWHAADGGSIDLASAMHGAYVVAANNEHFGRAATLLMPGRGVNMGDGWETRRRREPGNDWCIIALAHPGVIERVEVDTAFFKGNYADRFSLQAARVAGGTDQSVVTQAMFWPELMGETTLQMDHVHVFDAGLAALGAVSHVRFNIFPDGGVSRLRLFGRPA
jgi:allantoicase